MNVLLRWWRARQRRVDLSILWPVCKEQAGDIDRARAAFYMHAINDTAWTSDYSEDELISYVGTLS